MPLKHSFSILLSNFKLVGKLFVFFLIIILIACAIFISIFSPVLKDFFSEIQENFRINADELVQHPILTLKSLFSHLSEFIAENQSMMFMKLLYLWLLIIGSRFLYTLTILPVTKILYDKMTTGFDMGLTNAAIKMLPQNLLVSLITSVVLGTVDMLLLAALYYIMTGLLALINIIALPICLLIALLLFTLRMTLVCQWLPHICIETERKNIFIAFKKCLKPTFKNFRKNFICIFVIVVSTVTVFLVTLIPTVGLVPILLIPTCIVMYSAMCLALNFSYFQQKYFIDNGVTVYNPVKKYE